MMTVLKLIAAKHDDEHKTPQLKRKEGWWVFNWGASVSEFCLPQPACSFTNVFSACHILPPQNEPWTTPTAPKLQSFGTWANSELLPPVPPRKTPTLVLPKEELVAGGNWTRGQKREPYFARRKKWEPSLTANRSQESPTEQNISKCSV